MIQRQVQILLTLLFVTLAVSNACKYLKFSPMHSYCLPPNPQCELLDTGVTNADKQLVVKLHNEYRQKVATGHERHAGGMPPAANMLEMVWDNELAAVAQKHAEQCKFEHDCNECREVDRFSVGQNIYEGMSSGPPKHSDWEPMVKSFYDEVSMFDKSYIKPYVFGAWGHFSQVVWATSWRVGCGRATFMEDGWYTTFLVCNYGPAGNMYDGEMYKVGAPCSACPSGTCCGSSCQRHGIRADYRGLCKVINENNFSISSK
ncbi:hypothetical protein CDAR_460641 [Caerostris darwini]|uniref:SCP domain-containing protein n=1 Tax=Caerostris darwini TaxID=1538125 RepID=A0AAV4PV71_9ARAC|nr:hypothetical protein CDAR_460641 [Caerostris darwini]